MILIELRMCDRNEKNGQVSDELKQRRDIMEQKKENHCGCGGCAGADGGAYGMEKI